MDDEMFMALFKNLASLQEIDDKDTSAEIGTSILEYFCIISLVTVTYQIGLLNFQVYNICNPVFFLAVYSTVLVHTNMTRIPENFENFQEIIHSLIRILESYEKL